MSKIKDEYLLACVKKKILLGADLQWIHFSSFNQPTRPIPLVLGLERADALRLASWFTVNGHTVSPYLAEPFLKNQKIFQSEPIKRLSLTHTELEQKVSRAEYPACIMNVPKSKDEKRKLPLLITKMNMSSPNDSSLETVKTKEASTRPQSIVTEGVSNMFYIVNVKTGEILTKSLSWIPIYMLKKKSKKFNMLLGIKSGVVAAQNLCMWLTYAGETISPCTAKTLTKKYKVHFPSAQQDSLAEGVKSGKYPKCFLRRPTDKREVLAFQIALREGLENLEKRMNESFGGIDSSPAFATSIAEAANQEGASASTGMVDSCLSTTEANEGGLSLAAHGADMHLNFFKDGAIEESSTMIKRMLEATISFKEVIDNISQLIAQKRLELRFIQKNLVDLDHMTEFYNLNAADGYRVSKKRQELLQERRTIKNELIVLDFAQTCFLGTALTNKLQGFINSVNGMNHRLYSTRIMSESDVKDMVHNPGTLAAILGEPN